MHRRWLALGVVLLLGCAGGGVPKADFDKHVADFDTWKASVQKSGNAVDEWIKDAHNVIKWVTDNGGTFCPSCDPPNPPPTPPPNGEW